MAPPISRKLITAESASARERQQPIGEGRSEPALRRSQWQAAEDSAADMAAVVGQFGDVSGFSVTSIGVKGTEQLPR